MSFKTVTNNKLCCKTVKNVEKQLQKDLFNEKDLFSKRMV